VIAVDTNILVYAHRRDAAWHEKAAAVLRELAEGPGAWAVPWPCLHEFLSVVTHPRIYRPPTPLEAALAQVAAWLESPTLSLLAEVPGAWDVVRKVASQGRITGPAVYDARTASLCIVHGARSLWTADRDFGRFAGLSTRNPLLDS